MSAMRKAIQYLGFDVADGDQYDDAHDYAPVTDINDMSEARERREARKPHTRTRHEQSEVSAEDLRRIQSIKPRSYNDALLIGEAFRMGVPVIINLTELSDADAKRLVDFAAGLSFGLRGTIERVTTAVFLLSPAHVEVEVDVEPPAPQRSEFLGVR